MAHNITPEKDPSLNPPPPPPSVPKATPAQIEITETASAAISSPQTPPEPVHKKGKMEPPTPVPPKSKGLKARVNLALLTIPGSTVQPSQEIAQNTLQLPQAAPAQSISVEDIRRNLTQIELEEKNRYIRVFDNQDGESVNGYLARTHNVEAGQINYNNVEVGITEGTKVVTVKTSEDQEVKYILKKVTLPKGILTEGDVDFRRTIMNELNAAPGNTRDKVYQTFINTPLNTGTRDRPYLNNAAREKFASIISESVPKTSLLYDQTGIYSLHEFTPNVGTGVECDIIGLDKLGLVDKQSIQSIALLDMLIENQDRNAGNILLVVNGEREVSDEERKVIEQNCKVIATQQRTMGINNINEEQMVYSEITKRSKTYRCVPIDHSLSFQRNNFKQEQFHFPFIWEKLPSANDPLTEVSKQWILNFDAEQIIQTAEETLNLELEVKTSLKQNAEHLQNIIRESGSNALTLKDLKEKFYSV